MPYQPNENSALTTANVDYLDAHADAHDTGYASDAWKYDEEFEKAASVISGTDIVENQLRSRHSIQSGGSGGSEDGHGHGGGSPASTNDIRTFINFLKSYIGSGILGLPYAFLQGGVLMSIACLIILAVISNYCIRLLLQCCDSLELKHGRLSFGGLGQVIFGKPGRIIVDACLIFTQLGFCCAYVIFIGDNIEGILKNYGIAFCPNETVCPSYVYVLMLIPFLILVTWMRSFKMLAVLSLFGQIAMFFGLIIITVFAFISTVEEDYVIHGVNWKGLPIFFGMAVYTYEGIGLVIPMRRAMINPTHYHYIMDIGYLVMTVIFVGFGTIGYTGYGPNVDSGGITLNLPPDSYWTLATQISLILAIFATYPVQMYPVVAIIEGLVFKNIKMMTKLRGASLTWGKNLIRALLVVTTSLVAVSIPFFSLFVSLIGALGSSTIAFILPCLFHFVLFKKTLNSWLKLVDLCIIVFGIIASLISTTVTIYQLVEAIQDSLSS